MVKSSQLYVPGEGMFFLQGKLTLARHSHQEGATEGVLSTEKFPVGSDVQFSGIPFFVCPYSHKTLSCNEMLAIGVSDVVGYYKEVHSDSTDWT